jgi:uncharacterized protein YbbC (DUF1343 family)
MTAAPQCLISDEIITDYQKELESFKKIRQEYLLYK